MAYNIAKNENDSNIEARTRLSSATGPAWTNPRAAAMGSKANANFIVSKRFV